MKIDFKEFKKTYYQIKKFCLHSEYNIIFLTIAVIAIIFATFSGFLCAYLLFGIFALLLGKQIIRYVLRNEEKNNSEIRIVDAIIISAVIPFIVAYIILIVKQNYWIRMTEFHKNEYISVFGAILTYFGTAFLGLLAYYQNIKLNEQNSLNQKMNNSETLPSLSLIQKDFSIKVFDDIKILKQSGDSNCLGIKFKKIQNQYYVYLRPDKIDKDADWVWINQQIRLNYLGKARCNKFNINKVTVFYGNSESNREKIEGYLLPSQNSLMDSIIVGGEQLVFEIDMIAPRYFANHEDIIKNDTNTVFMEFKIQLTDISGIQYSTQLKYSFVWNDSPNIKSYLLCNNNFIIKDVTVLSKN